MPEFPKHELLTRLKEGQLWRIGTKDDVAWINTGVTPGQSIAAAVPPIFRGYATLTFPLDAASDRDALRPAEDRFDDSLIRVLSTHTQPQPWWLGFLDTGASDVVLNDAPRVLVYSGWPYVLAQGGPQEARTWRGDEGRWFTALPELMFPADHGWLVSSLWDDAWACVAGSADLIDGLLIEPELRGRAERTDPSVPDMWPTALPDWMHQQLKRLPAWPRQDWCVRSGVCSVGRHPGTA